MRSAETWIMKLTSFGTMTNDILENGMDADAFQAPIDEIRFVSEVRRLANRFARRVTSDDDAEDIAQDVTLRCLMLLRRHRWRIDSTPEAFIASMTWRMYATRMRNDARRRRRERQYMAERTAVAPGWMNPAFASEEQEDNRLYERALDELPAGCRSTFLLVRECGMTYRDAAHQEGVSLGMVAKRIARAERLLTDRLLDTPRWRGMPPTMERQSHARQHITREGRIPGH